VGPNTPYRQVKIVDDRTVFEVDGNIAIGKLDQGHIVLENWDLTGHVIPSADSQAIRWSNETTWFRSKATGPPTR